MLEITRKNCYKCDLETVTLNDSQYFWINIKDLEVETERSWVNISNKHVDPSTLKYRKELTQDIQFQPDRIFTRNDLFQKIIKNYKESNAEFLILREKLGLCPYEVICDEKEFILMPGIQNDAKASKKENTESMKIKNSYKSSNESIKIKRSDKSIEIESSDKLTDKSIEIESSDESTDESIEIKSPNNDENTTDWYDKDKFEKILAIVDSDIFNYNNEIEKLKYSDIMNLIINIKNSPIREILAKKSLHALNEIKKTEIRNKRLISSQKN